MGSIHISLSPNSEGRKIAGDQALSPQSSQSFQVHYISSFYNLALSRVSLESRRCLVAVSPSHSSRLLSGSISLLPLPDSCF